MELITSIRSRIARYRYVWSWRLRYWWLDTARGRQAQIGLACMGLMVMIGLGVRMWFVPHAASAHAPHEAIIGVIIAIVIAVLAAAIAVASMPKVKGPQASQGNVPNTTEGQAIRDHFGTCWEDDSWILAWKQMGTVPIKSSGGK